MDFSSLLRQVHLRSGTYVMLRPGITLRLSYPEPIQTLGPHIADILESYMQFISPEVLGIYLASNGAWKVLPKRVLARDLEELRSIPPHYEFVEYHYGHGEPSHVGHYGAHFVGSHLRNVSAPHEENLLLLEFPHDLLEKRSPDTFIDYVTNVANRHPFGSGLAGYAFKHLHLTFRDEAFASIRQLAPRYIGFDISSDSAAEYSRDRVYNVSWLTLLGTHLVAELGGTDAIRAALPRSIGILPLRGGVLLRASEQPIVGDVNRGAQDVAPLRAMAALTRSLRLKAPNVGPGVDFTAEWLARLDA